MTSVRPDASETQTWPHAHVASRGVRVPGRRASGTGGGRVLSGWGALALRWGGVQRKGGLDLVFVDACLPRQPSLPPPLVPAASGVGRTRTLTPHAQTLAQAMRGHFCGQG